MEEKVFLEDGDVKVTSSRFLVGEETYSVANITSVKSSSEPSKAAGWGALLAIIGLITMFSGEWGAAFFGLLLLGLGIGIAAKSKETKFVILTTAGSETKALKDTDADRIKRVIAALNDAIIYRG